MKNPTEHSLELFAQIQEATRCTNEQAKKGAVLIASTVLGVIESGKIDGEYWHKVLQAANDIS